MGAHGKPDPKLAESDALRQRMVEGLAQRGEVGTQYLRGAQALGRGRNRVPLVGGRGEPAVDAWRSTVAPNGHRVELGQSRPTRCPGWDVACLYAHVSVFPLVMSAPPPVLNGPVGEPLTAVEVLRRFNAPGGVATTMAKTVADAAVTEAAEHTRAQLVDRFTVQGSRALHGLRKTEPTTVVPWPASDGVMTLVEALRIVLIEATVHLLDVQRALDHPPAVPVQALQHVAAFLAAMVDPVEFIEGATGRTSIPVLPVLR
ncbi:MAG: maleylpyruvate isomerase family mycothiol-dependent enzyme [Pseudonocardiaceae bacterium]